MVDLGAMVMEACRDSGLHVVGPTDAPGTEGGVLVAHGLGSAPLERLGGGYRLIPSGRRHTIVMPPRWEDYVDEHGYA